MSAFATSLCFEIPYDGNLQLAFEVSWQVYCWEQVTIYFTISFSLVSLKISGFLIRRNTINYFLWLYGRISMIPYVQVGMCANTSAYIYILGSSTANPPCCCRKTRACSLALTSAEWLRWFQLLPSFSLKLLICLDPELELLSLKVIF